MKVLVTGLGLAHDFGICEPCGMNYSWLINNPSTLLWADKIVFPKKSFNAQLEENDNKESIAINLILEIAKDNNLIETFNVEDILHEGVTPDFDAEGQMDSKILLENFPDNITEGNYKEVPGEILIDGRPYCYAKIAAINASIFLSNELNANCLFDKYEYNFLKYKFSSPMTYNEQLFSEVFSPVLPNEMILHNYAFTDEEHCRNCQKYEECQKTYLNSIEKAMINIVNLRNRDEILVAKNELQNLIDTKNDLTTLKDLEDLKKEYQEKQVKINKNIYKVFPKVKRWTNITSILATPFTVGAALCGEVGVAAAGAAALVGITKISEEYMKYYENKNKWVGFINNPHTIP